MTFGKSLLVQVVGGLLTLAIAFVCKLTYEKYFYTPPGGIEMSFFQMLLSIIVLFIFVNAIIWGGLAWRSRSSINKSQEIYTSLFKYASHPEQLFIIDPEGKLIIGGHAGNYDWKELTEWLCKNMGIKHLRYSNIGSEYHLVDIGSGKKYKIPTDKELETKIENSGLRNGQILLITRNT
jgi:hypothetical protein